VPRQAVGREWRAVNRATPGVAAFKEVIDFDAVLCGLRFFFGYESETQKSESHASEYAGLWTAENEERPAVMEVG